MTAPFPAYFESWTPDPLEWANTPPNPAPSYAAIPTVPGFGGGSIPPATQVLEIVPPLGSNLDACLDASRMLNFPNADEQYQLTFYLRTRNPLLAAGTFLLPDQIFASVEVLGTDGSWICPAIGSNYFSPTTWRHEQWTRIVATYDIPDIGYANQLRLVWGNFAGFPVDTAIEIAMPVGRGGYPLDLQQSAWGGPGYLASNIPTLPVLNAPGTDDVLRFDPMPGFPLPEWIESSQVGGGYWYGWKTLRLRVRTSIDGYDSSQLLSEIEILGNLGSALLPVTPINWLSSEWIGIALDVADASTELGFVQKIRLHNPNPAIEDCSLEIGDAYLSGAPQPVYLDYVWWTGGVDAANWIDSAIPPATCVLGANGGPGNVPSAAIASIQPPDGLSLSGRTLECAAPPPGMPAVPGRAQIWIKVQSQRSYSLGAILASITFNRPGGPETFAFPSDGDENRIEPFRWYRVEPLYAGGPGTPGDPTTIDLLLGDGWDAGDSLQVGLGGMNEGEDPPEPFDCSGVGGYPAELGVGTAPDWADAGGTGLGFSNVPSPPGGDDPGGTVLEVSALGGLVNGIAERLPVEAGYSDAWTTAILYLRWSGRIPIALPAIDGGGNALLSAIELVGDAGNDSLPDDPTPIPADTWVRLDLGRIPAASIGNLIRWQVRWGTNPGLDDLLSTQLLLCLIDEEPPPEPFDCSGIGGYPAEIGVGTAPDWADLLGVGIGFANVPSPPGGIDPGGTVLLVSGALSGSIALRNPIEPGYYDGWTTAVVFVRFEVNGEDLTLPFLAADGTGLLQRIEFPGDLGSNLLPDVTTNIDSGIWYRFDIGRVGGAIGDLQPWDVAWGDSDLMAMVTETYLLVCLIGEEPPETCQVQTHEGFYKHAWVLNPCGFPPVYKPARCDDDGRLLVSAIGALIVSGTDAEGDPETVHPVTVGGQDDGGLVRKFLTDDLGRQRVVGSAADGAAAAGDPVLIAGMDGAGNVESVLTDTAGRPVVVGAAADGVAIAGDPLRVAGQDAGGTTRAVRSTQAGYPVATLPPLSYAVGNLAGGVGTQLVAATVGLRCYGYTASNASPANQQARLLDGALDASPPFAVADVSTCCSHSASWPAGVACPNGIRGLDAGGGSWVISIYYRVDLL